MIGPMLTKAELPPFLLSPGRRIRLLRALCGWSQTELAHFLQTTQRTVAKLEADAWYPSEAMRSRCRQLFAVTDRWLIHGILPVFDRPAVLFVLPDLSCSGRRLAAIARVLDDHLPAFWEEVRIQEVWHFGRDLFIVRSVETWMFLSAGIFENEVVKAVYRMPVSMRTLSPPARELLMTPDNFAEVLRELAPHLAIPPSQVEGLITSVQVQLRQRDAVWRDAVRTTLLTHMRAMLAASGLSREEMAELLETLKATLPPNDGSASLTDQGPT